MRIKKYKKIKDGTIREVKKFAWIPKRINYELIWLSSYKIKQRYYNGQYGESWTTIDIYR